MVQNAFLFAWECLHLYINNNCVNNSKMFGNNCTQRFWTYLIGCWQNDNIERLEVLTIVILWIHNINSRFKFTARDALAYLKILHQSQFLPLKFVLSKSLSLLFRLACKMHTTWVCQVQLLFIMHIKKRCIFRNTYCLLLLYVLIWLYCLIFFHFSRDQNSDFSGKVCWVIYT